MADANRCPICGAEHPPDTAQGLCPRCLMRLAMAADTAVPLQPTEANLDATQARNSGPADATGEWSPSPGDSEATTDGPGTSPDLPRGTTVRYFGDYEIQKELGRGGMGVVYKARQVSLNRPVALKMIKAGVLADDAELKRFQNEAEAVALLDHAGIVPVYEVGEHDGQRYFSMKLVEGGNLAERLAAMKANPRAAAALVAEMAEAVHHAHMRGILHRDLKPANILIDAEGHPHVTDFGLAKRVEADVEMTQSGAILGTPAYMSPEQATGRRGSITTATDVYGLGAILYALLTGKAPFGGDSVIETLDAVRTRPPEPPTKSNAHVPRDLGTICLKCLEKDPRRRYASAHELALDLTNWLDSRPITARRVGTTERAWLWCKRKPVVAALAASVLLALIGGTSGIFAVQARANINLRSANGKLDQANAELKSSNNLLDQQRTRAEKREQQAIDAVKKFRDAVANNEVLKNNPALESLRKTLLKEPLAFFKTLREQLQADPDTRPDSLARLADAIHDYAHLADEIGDVRDSLRSHEESLPIWQRLATAHPDKEDYQTGLARILHCRGVMQHSTGQVEHALDSFGKALAIRDRLAREDPAVTQFASDLAASHLEIGLLQSQTGQSDRALESYGKALAIQERLARENPAVTQFASDLANSHYSIGIHQSEMGQPERALESYGKALAILERLARDNPAVTEFASQIGGALHNIARIDLAQRRFPAAKQRLLDAITWQKKALAANPRNPTYRQFLQNHYTVLQIAAQALGDAALAQEAQRGTVELAATHPRFQALDARLVAIAKGDSPKDNAERLAMGQRAYDTKRYALAARLWSEALETDPKLADDRQVGHRYNAACAATLAATGQGKDEPKPDDAAQAKLRKQALAWLKAELSEWQRVSTNTEAGNKELVAKTLAHWKQDPDLASLRDSPQLAKLPEAERKDWQALWAEVEALLKRTQGRKP